MARVDRLHIGIFGRINAGKSTFMNVLTQQETSIVDPTPGTTTDIKAAVMEVHALGPVKILDTAGLDEGEALGAKKRGKTLSALEQVDLAVLVVDPVQALQSGNLQIEEEVATACRRLGHALVMVCNVRADHDAALQACGATLDQAVDHCKSALADRVGTPVLVIDLTQESALPAVVDLLTRGRPSPSKDVELLPFVGGQAPVLLHIPLDEESPSQRLLRPQEMAMEYLLRLRVPVGMARADLKLARSGNPVLAGRERDKFLRFFEKLGGADDVQLVLTDSQAIDLMHDWLPPEVPLTTFSVMMIHQTCGGNLALFARGTRTLDTLQAGDRVLIAEACNHDRMAEDIGTVQIPRKLEQRIPGIVVDHAFGREFPDKQSLQAYKLAIHCGGCMISKQQASARVLRLAEAGIPVSNYGMVLAWFQGTSALERVLRPWLPSLPSP
jgi:small GTP-binding protein